MQRSRLLMCTLSVIVLLPLVGCGSALRGRTLAQRAESRGPDGVLANVITLPLAFEAHQQPGADTLLLARGDRYSVSVAGAPALTLHPAGDVAPVTLTPLGGDVGARREVEVPLPGRTNYFIGNVPAEWQRDVPTFARVRYREVYPGIDLVLYGTQGKLEYDFVVAPGANPDVIRVQVTGAEAVSITDSGSVILRSEFGDIEQRAPVVYQEVDGVRQVVIGRHWLEGSNIIRFELDDYDRARPLVIDPVLSFSTYLGNAVTYARGVAVDAEGFIYVTGSTTTSSFPIMGGLPLGFRGGTADGFVVKLSPSGDQIVYSTFIGGSFGGSTGFGGQDYGQALAVDAFGQVHLIGSTFSRDFPIVNPFQAATPTSPTVDGQSDVFVAKFNAAGNDLVFSTYLGGLYQDQPGDIVVDANGNTFAVGDTLSVDFPVLNAIQPAKALAADEALRPLRPDLFITKLGPTGVGLFSTYFGGTAHEYGMGAALDTAGNLVVGGSTDSTDYPTVNPIKPCTGVFASYITKLNAAGTAVMYSTCFWTHIRDVAVDGANAIYVAGGASTPGTLPTTPGAFQTTFGGSSYDMFAAKLTPAGDALVYATYIGSSGHEHAFALAVDEAGAAYIGGSTESATFPVAHAIQPVPGGVGHQNHDGVVVKLSPGGNALEYSTYLGGNSGFGEQVSAIAVDGQGNAVAAGWTDGGSFPITPGVVQPTKVGQRVGFVSKISPGTAPCVPLFGSAGATVSASGGPGSTNIVAQASDCTWNLSSNASWLIITSNPAGSGLGTVSYTVGFNSGPSRVAALTLGTATYTVFQEGAPGTCALSLSPTSSTATNAGGDGTIAVSTGLGCAWTAASNTAWIAVSSGVSGTGSGTVSYSVAANISPQSRTGSITVGGATFTISQQGTPAALNPPPADLLAAITGNSVALTWRPPAGAAPTGYLLEAGTAPGLSNIAAFATGNLATSFAALVPNGTYYVRVRAIYGGGTSAPSNEVTLIVGCVEPPEPPTRPQVELANGMVLLSWVPASGATEQALEAGSASGLANVAVVSLPGTQHAFGALAPPGTYFVRLKSRNACGVSGASAEIYFTVGAGVPLPKAPIGVMATTASGGVTISWLAPEGGATGYLLEAGSKPDLANLASVALGPAPTYVATGVPPGTYYVRVRAVSAAGTGPPSADIVVVVP